MREFTAQLAKASRISRGIAGIKKLPSAILLALVLALSSAPALAQGCAMCYATAKATPKEGQLALNRAILVMILPPIAAMTLGIGAAFRYGKKRDREENSRG